MSVCEAPAHNICDDVTDDSASRDNCEDALDDNLSIHLPCSVYRNNAGLLLGQVFPLLTPARGLFKHRSADGRGLTQ